MLRAPWPAVGGLPEPWAPHVGPLSAPGARGSLPAWPPRPAPRDPYPQPQCARRSPEAPALTSLPSSGRISPLSWLRLSLMRARRRFSSSGFRLCRRACRPRLRPGPSPRRSAPRRQSPGSYLAQLRRVPCPPRQPHSRRESGAAVGPAGGDLRASARTPKEDRGPQGGPVHDQSRSQWCARHACSRALRRQRARPAPPRGVRQPVGPTSAFVPARGGGGRGDGGAPGIPLQALASHLRRGRGPGAPSSQRTCGGVCGLEGRGWGQALALPCPATPFFSRSRSAAPLSPALGLGRGPRGGGTPKSPASGSYYSAQVSTTGRDSSPHQLACGAGRGD